MPITQRPSRATDKFATWVHAAHLDARLSMEARVRPRAASRSRSSALVLALVTIVDAPSVDKPVLATPDSAKACKVVGRHVVAAIKPGPGASNASARRVRPGCWPLPGCTSGCTREALQEIRSIRQQPRPGPGDDAPHSVRSATHHLRGCEPGPSQLRQRMLGCEHPAPGAPPHPLGLG